MIIKQQKPIYLKSSDYNTLEVIAKNHTKMLDYLIIQPTYIYISFSNKTKSYSPNPKSTGKTLSSVLLLGF